MSRRGAVRTVATMTTTSQVTLDELSIDDQAVEEFAGRLFELLTSAALAALIDIGHRTGLLEAASSGPATSPELAARAGLEERYVREWLAAMVTSGIAEYEPTKATYWLPSEHAASLTGSGVANMAPMARLMSMLASHVPAVADAFRKGGGVPYDAFVPEIHDVMDGLWRPMYRDLLVSEILPLAPGLEESLRRGARVADVACGTGNGLLVLATGFPASTFTGFDIDEDALARGRAEASDRGLTNVTFEQCDAAELSVATPFDVVLVFNAIHDQVAPAAVLGRIHASLAPNGTFLMNEPRVSSNLEDNIDNPVAPFIYAVSTLHCMTVSLAAGGAGLGTGWGEQLACQLLADAGFVDLAVHDAPRDPVNAVFVARKPSTT